MSVADPVRPTDPPDHRRLGRQLDLFESHELVGAGLPLWLPDGAVIRFELERFVVELERVAGYQRVFSPVLGKRELFERSGHWQHFRDDMFPPMDTGEEQLVLRPSNCPHHLLMYGARHHSFRELPVRYAELGTMFRYERSGVVGGLSRVRAMTLSDAHVFVAAEQVGAEVARMLELIDHAYGVLGIDPHRLRLSLRGPGGSYVDAPQMWERAEDALRSALASAGARWDEAADEAAFYGPKVDIQVVDPQGREETLSTVQIDFHQPEAFDLWFQASDGSRQRPVVIHRALVSTMERLVAHLIEQYAGRFPVWLAPVQLAVAPVDADHDAAAQSLVDSATGAGLRARMVDARHSLGARVRAAHEQGVPFVGIIGDREVADGSVSLRRRDGGQLPAMPVAGAVGLIAGLAADRALGLDADTPG
ncbi:MAG TPA: threonine--tRNA ligase [Euzebyales bacterium]